jgi:hypothetical protein
VSGQEGTPNGVDRLAHIDPDFLLFMLRDEPRLEREGAMVSLTVEGETYWRVCGCDLHALLTAREYLLARLAPPAEDQEDSGA